MKNKIKITGGYLKNKNIYIKSNKNLKPTMSKIRKILFNWISKKIKNSRCLDCFAGSGMLSIESISRKANYIISLEINNKINKNIINNLKKLNINKIKIININAIKWLKKNFYIFDIIFLDPPLYKNLIKKIIILLKKKILKRKIFIYIEIENKKKKTFILNNLILKKELITKKIIYRLYYYKPKLI